MSKKEQRNVEINEEIWRNAGALAAQLGITKKELVKQALELYFQFALKK
jgi:hypothetical protein